MNILLGNNTLALLAGSETHTYTLALQLQKMGHNVSCYSPELGVISEKLKAANIESYDHLNTEGVRMFSPVFEPQRDHQYDVIIANHFHIVQQLRARFPKTPIISTIHGIIHLHEDGTTWAPEHPATDAGVSQFVAVSEEVKDILNVQYSIDAKVIRNFFDIKRFTALPAPAQKPQQFLINTNYMGTDDPVVQLIRDTAKLMGAKVAAIGMNFSPMFNTELALKDADVVFGMGRSVLEGVAAGRLGVVLGRWGYGGIIKESTVETIRRFNFSGRNAADPQELPTPEELAKHITEAYQPSILDWGKQYVAREHNAVLAAEAYMRLANELTGRDINQPVPALAVNPNAQPLRKAYAD